MSDFWQIEVLVRQLNEAAERAVRLLVIATICLGIAILTLLALIIAALAT